MKSAVAVALLITTLCGGCACRRPGEARMFHLWNRNEVVADPTEVGNLLGVAVLGVPAIAVVYAVTSPMLLVVSPKDFGETMRGSFFGIVTASAMAGGALLGTPFIVPSLFFPENPPEHCFQM